MCALPFSRFMRGPDSESVAAESLDDPWREDPGCYKKAICLGLCLGLCPKTRFGWGTVKAGPPLQRVGDKLTNTHAFRRPLVSRTFGPENLWYFGPADHRTVELPLTMINSWTKPCVGRYRRTTAEGELARRYYLQKPLQRDFASQLNALKADHVSKMGAQETEHLAKSQRVVVELWPEYQKFHRGECNGKRPKPHEEQDFESRRAKSSAKRQRPPGGRDWHIRGRATRSSEQTRSIRQDAIGRAVRDHCQSAALGSGATCGHFGNSASRLGGAMSKRSKSGFPGVTRCPNGRWRVRVGIFDETSTWPTFRS
jgi:hypothetical protein